MNQILRHILVFGIYLFFQLFFFDGLTLFRVATPYVFLLFLLTLSFRIPPPVLYLVAFGTGLMMDMLSDMSVTGLHAFSSLLMIGLREFWVQLISSSTVRNAGEINLQAQSTLWLLSYFLPLIFVHHTAFYLLESLTFTHFFYKVLQIIASSVYTFVLCYLIFFIFYKR